MDKTIETLVNNISSNAKSIHKLTVSLEKHLTYHETKDKIYKNITGAIATIQIILLILITLKIF